MNSAIYLDHTSLTFPVGGEETARAFFGELLGLREIPKPDDGNRMDGCWFDLGEGMQLHLLSDANFVSAKRAHPAFCVADLKDYRLRLEQGGVPILDFQPSEGRERFFTEDPFGNRLEFISPRKNP